jgi:type VI secretion system secreted protein VgrG
MMNTGRRASRGRARYAWLAASPLAASAVAAGAAALFIATPHALAATAQVGLGTAGSFGVLAGTMVANTGPSVINGGDLGVDPGTAVTGFPPGTVNGTIYTATGPGTVAADAQADLTVAYNDAAGRTPATAIPAAIGSGGIDPAEFAQLAPGIYKASSSLDVFGTLTLNAGGEADAVWIFQVPSALMTDPTGSSVVLTNGAQACNVFWQVGSSATLNTGTPFQGTILALASITMPGAVTIDGRALARNGDVTLNDDTINVPAACPPSTGSSPSASPTSASPTGTATTTASPTGTATTTASPTGTATTTASPTAVPPSPGPSPTGTGPTPLPPSPAPTPSPIRSPFPVTG